MKFFIIIILLYGFTSSYGQVFFPPNSPSGYEKDKKRTIPSCDASPVIPSLLKFKDNTKARRFTYDIGLWPNLYQLDGQNDIFCYGNCTITWNKIGRISLSYLQTNKYKLHLGWRADKDIENELKLSAYFHEVPKTQGKEDTFFSWHYIKNVAVNTQHYIDMYLSLGMVSLIVDKDAVVIRKPNFCPDDNKTSYFGRVFYFGDSWISKADKCVAKEDLSVEFRNQEYDWDGYEEMLNASDVITVNLSTFKKGDAHEFFAYDRINGSTETTGNVGMQSGHPDSMFHQKCIIEAGADISFKSSGTIRLHKGFHAKSGSKFRATKVSHCYPDVFFLLYLNTAYGIKCKMTIKNAVHYDQYHVLVTLSGVPMFEQVVNSTERNQYIDLGILPAGKYKYEVTLINTLCGKENKKIGSFSILTKESEEKQDSTYYPTKEKEFVANTEVLQNQRLIIFPNPNNGKFTIDFYDHDFDNYTLQIIDINGIKIMEQNFPMKKQEIDLSGYGKGFYFIKLITLKETIIRKVIVK